MRSIRLPFRLVPLQRPDWRGSLPALRAVANPRELHVPIIGASASGIRIIPSGRVVTAGQSLLADDCPGVAVAPLEGRVVGLSEARLTSVRRVPAVRLDVLSEQRPPAFAGPPPAQGALWIELFLRSGIWSDRATCPDLLSQFALLRSRPVNTVICSLLDQEPPLSLNALLAQHCAAELAGGLDVLQQITSARRAIFVIDEAWPAAIRQPLVQAAQPAKLHIAEMSACYPEGLPPLLLQAVLDRNLRPGRSPLERGVLLLDGPAAFAIGARILHDRPMVQVPLALRDHQRRQSHYLLVPVGMKIDDLLGSLGITSGGMDLFAGDVLRQIRVPPDAVVAGCELHLHVMPAQAASAAAACVRCNSCADCCPMGVHPAFIAEAAQEDDAGLAAQAGIDSCIQCGVCDLVCPSELPLMACIRKLKAT